MKSFSFIFCLLLLLSCGNNDNGVKNENIKSTTHESATKTNSSDNSKTDNENNTDQRKAWQKPELVIEKLGNLSEAVIVDIGAGTGYFSFPLMRKAKKVIAIDIDPRMIKFIEALKTSLPEKFQSKLETRLATPNDPNLKPEEADVILIVNTIAYIENRVEYLKNLKTFLKPGGKIAIIDFKMKRMEIDAPPFEDRILLHEIEEQLYQAGYQYIRTDDTSLEYQYFLFGEK